MLFSDEIPSVIRLYSLLSLCFSGDVVDSQSTQFDLGTLTLYSLKLLGDAHLSNGSLRLTRDLSVPNSGPGRILYSKSVRFRQPETPPASFLTFAPSRSLISTHLPLVGDSLF
uniref:Uncharacterized protein n=1 Tax=Nelumbo nucifera TaxID=4432 RepID=A0A822XLW6_NELNU|nr:TPA_asm: hypothetical protein HUJ06_022166 [Nelumbo nucifera]